MRRRQNYNTTGDQVHDVAEWDFTSSQTSRGAIHKPRLSGRAGGHPFSPSSKRVDYCPMVRRPPDFLFHNSVFLSDTSELDIPIIALALRVQQTVLPSFEPLIAFRRPHPCILAHQRCFFLSFFFVFFMTWLFIVFSTFRHSFPRLFTSCFLSFLRLSPTPLFPLMRLRLWV